MPRLFSNLAIAIALMAMAVLPFIATTSTHADIQNQDFTTKYSMSHINSRAEEMFSGFIHQEELLDDSCIQNIKISRMDESEPAEKPSDAQDSLVQTMDTESPSSEVSLKIECRGFEENQAAELALKHPNLEHLSLHFDQSCKMSDTTLKSLLQSVGELSSLTSLSLTVFEFWESGEYPSLYKAGICEALTKIQHLNTLMLRPNIPSVNGPLEMVRLSECISKLPQLTDLHLDFGLPNRFDPEDQFSAFVQQISALQNIKSLTLKFKNWIMQDNSLVTLSQVISKLTSLERLDLDLATFAWNITDLGVTALADFISQLPNLRWLQIKLGEEDIGALGNSLAYLAKQFSKIQTLNHFGLHLSQSLINSYVQISRTPPQYENGYEFVPTPEHIFSEFCEHLSHFANLTSLDLDFYGFIRSPHKLSKAKEAYDAFLYLSHALKNQHSLESLRLKWKTYPAISENGLAQLSLALSRLSKLNTLSLEFEPTTKELDSGIVWLSEAISQLSYLRSLELVLARGGYGVSDQGLPRLSQELSKLQNLDTLKLELWLSSRANITADGFIEFSKHLPNAPVWKTCDVRIGFYWSHYYPESYKTREHLIHPQETVELDPRLDEGQIKNTENEISKLLNTEKYQFSLTSTKDRMISAVTYLLLEDKKLHIFYSLKLKN